MHVQFNSRWPSEEPSSDFCHYALPFGAFSVNARTQESGINFVFTENGAMKTQTSITFSIRDPDFDGELVGPSIGNIC